MEYNRNLLNLNWEHYSTMVFKVHGRMMYVVPNGADPTNFLKTT